MFASVLLVGCNGTDDEGALGDDTTGEASEASSDTGGTDNSQSPVDDTGGIDSSQPPADDTDAESGEPELPEPIDPLLYHDGYWVMEIADPASGGALQAINDMHIDTTTLRATVYAQTRVDGEVQAPPQVGPGECTETSDGETVCFHPNAVYLNGTGQELDTADGTGAWWVKHSWVLGGEGYENCPLGAEENYTCFWVEGVLLEDGLTMQIGGTGDATAGFFNTRTPLLDEDPIGYQVVRHTAGNAAPPLIFDCVPEVSEFDGRARPCPELAP
ncbi:MAG: hypothetical protein AAGF11_24280 [Myxococcota bacterium]